MNANANANAQPSLQLSRQRFDALSLPDAGTLEALQLVTSMLSIDVERALTLDAERFDADVALYCKTCRAMVGVRGGRAQDHARLGHRVTR